ncbi:uncharacterized protein C15orf61 isoform X1 [Frankliniella occidentalis]|uniref:Uncharacterized protein C15orf61 isoform X1 n=2 Tax=Frankliniella occidentalis TaxID=133901 RepID=A0A6J1SQK1_FRAOC|nr:uncharacterized protein C15orf61 isoform X1 [Frankliniella occidentalis]XP_026283559.2 uncharacterized protein C15orf61 isoform X1 [Frankliniella occidentalis]
MWSLFMTSRNMLELKIMSSVIQRLHSKSKKPLASEVLTCYLLQCKEPPWTSYFVRYSSVKDDQWGLSHFNWPAGNSNYHILRTGCYPFIKYHCSKRHHQDLALENFLMRLIKITNLCIPCLLYGLAATQLIRHEEEVHTQHGPVNIYFLYPEDKGSLH